MSDSVIYEGRFDDLFGRFYVALVYDEEEEYDAAIQALTDHLSGNRLNAVAFNNRAIAYAELGETERAFADFAEAIRLAPNDGHPALHRGMLFEHLGKLEHALADFDLAVSLAPDDPSPWCARGLARAATKDLPGAVGDFSRAIDLAEPQYRCTYINHRATVYERLGKTELARRDKEAASRM